MTKFKKGDRVRGNNNALNKVPRYIEGIIDGVYSDTYWIRLDDGIGDAIWHEGATLVSTTHIVASTTDGPSRNPFIHTSREAAIEEAERLARQNPGDEFAVYERVAGRVVNLTVTET